MARHEISSDAMASGARAAGARPDAVAVSIQSRIRDPHSHAFSSTMFALRRAQPFALLQRRAFAAAPMVRARLSHAIFLGPALVESIQIDMPRTLCLKIAGL